MLTASVSRCHHQRSALCRLVARPLSQVARRSLSNLARPALATSASRLNAFDVTRFSRHYATIIIKCPNIAESISEADISKLDVQEGEYVDADGQIATLETDKVDVAVPTKEAGILRKWLVAEGDRVTVGQDLAELETGVGAEAASTSSKKAVEEAKKPEPAAAPTPAAAPAAATPAPAPKAAEKSKPAESKKAAPTPSKGAESSAPAGAFSRTENRVKMTRMRLRIAENLKASQNSAASLTTFNEIDMSAIMGMRKQYKDAVLEKYGIKLGFMGAFVKAASIALKAYPAVNASLEEAGEDKVLVYRDYSDISVAVATPKGLVTPVIRNTESLDIVQVEEAIAAMGKKARDGKIAVEDMVGGTFTISNGGVFGSLMGTPIINMPQTAILGMHATKERAVVVNGQVVARPMMYVALTYDHRVIDGREAVSFLKMVKELIEDPNRMLLSV